MQDPVAKPAWSGKQQKNPNSNTLPVAFQRDQLLSAQAGDACKEERQSVDPAQQKFETSEFPPSMHVNELGQHQPESHCGAPAGQVPPGAVRAQPPAGRAVRLLGMWSASI
jgi:hypothetical protein